jgi:hypothetical protein
VLLEGAKEEMEVWSERGKGDKGEEIEVKEGIK